MPIAAQTKTARLAADGTLVANKCVVHSVWFVGQAGGAGSIVLKDGGSGGTVKVQLDTPASAAATVVPFVPGGIKFSTDCYLDLTNVDAVTVVYTDDDDD